MKSYNDILIKFYQNIGKLFYAIAISDKKINDVEYNSIKSIVHTKWNNVETSHILLQKSPSLVLIESINKLYKEQNIDAKACFSSFLDFKKKHEQLFTEVMKSKILTSCGEIASSFSGKNKSELILLATLSIEFKKNS